MNKAESEQIAAYLDSFGFKNANVIGDADLIILNTCVVRKSAEDKVLGMLGYLRGLKDSNPNQSIMVTGCFVDSNVEYLKKRFPQVELFFKPGDYEDLIERLHKKHSIKQKATTLSYTNKAKATAYVPIIQGCNNFCSYCIVPYRRGKEISRSLEEIINEVSCLVQNGVKEVTLLGQNVNSYGHDLPGHTDLSRLLNHLNNIDDLLRVRFLTNHPKDMNMNLIESIAGLDKVCEHLHLPLQAGDNEILKLMRRGYTVEQYRDLVTGIRNYIPDISLSTDIIVGFPGETDVQFEKTKSVVEEIRFDTVHIAAYSPREGTRASIELEDNVPAEVKKKRLEEIESLQSKILGEINSQLKGKSLEILVEGDKKGKWYGRTRSDKLVFFNHNVDYSGKLVNILISKTSPWSLQGDIESSVI